MSPGNDVIFSAFVAATLGQGHPYWWRPRGFSMCPTIGDGDRVLVAPVNPTRLRIGSIVKFRSAGELRLHRLIARRRHADELVFRGDAADAEEVVSAADIIGMAVAVERQGRTVSLDSTWARLMGRWRASSGRKHDM